MNLVSIPSFSSWNFVLWDYADEVTVDPATAAKHWQSLLDFIQKNNIQRLITNIKNPSRFPFYDTEQKVDENAFIYWAQKLKQDAPGCALHVFFDLDLFASSAPAVGPADLPSPFASLSKTTFLNLYQKMCWVEAMIQKGVPIKEVVIDPECQIVGEDNIGGGIGAKQLLLNFMNYYRSQSPSLEKVGLGAALGFDVKTMAFTNLSVLPLPGPQDPQYDLQSLLPAHQNYYNFPTKIDPTGWWGSQSVRPLLDSIYIEMYDPTIPYNFTLQNNPELAAENFLHLYRDEPYMPAKGTIAFDKNAKTVTGNNTQFTQGFENGTPLGVMQEGSMITIGRVNTIVSDTEAVFYSFPPFTSANSLYYLSESPLKWVFPSIQLPTNQSILDGIYFMFSLEPNPIDKQKQKLFSFFGNWTLDQFLTFLAHFYTLGQTTLPIYTQKEDPVYIPLPKQFGIYDFRQLQANPQFSSLF